MTEGQMNRGGRPAAHARTDEAATSGALAQRPEHAERIEIARKAGGAGRRLIGAVTPIRVTRKAGR
jgi:hypothetical protein